MRIACVGAGPAGLQFAILAALHGGHEVDVYERRSPGEAHGWGVTLPGETLHDLEARDPRLGREVRAATVAWCSERIVLGEERHTTLPGRGYAVGRQTLLSILRRRARELDVRLHHQTDLGDDDRVLERADLVVAADGVNSRLRQAGSGAFGTRVVHGRNKYAWLGTSRVFEAFTFRFASTPAGWVWAYAYPFDAETSTVVVETSPRTWAALGFDRSGAEPTLRLLEELFADELQGHRLRCSEGPLDAVPWAEFPRVTNERWYSGNRVLLGDAAHTTHFSIGSGTRLALDDAAALNDALARHTDVGPALVEYGRRRAAEIQQTQAIAANSGRWFENLPRYVQRDPEEFVRLLLLRRSSALQHLPPSAYLRLAGAASALPVLAAPARRATRLARLLTR